MSREKSNKSEIFSEQLRIFAKKKFGNLKNLSAALGISQQHLSMYLSGKREYGASFRERLASIGFFENESGELIELKQKSNNLESLNLNNNKTNIPIDIKGAIALSNTPLERLAQLLGVTPATFAAWQNGTATPTVEELSRLFNQVVALALSSRLASSRPEAEMQERGSKNVVG
jgi:transcriptional regulator with XRE-family HTH domain